MNQIPLLGKGPVEGGLAAGIAGVAVEGGARDPAPGPAPQKVAGVLGLGVLARRRGGDVVGVGLPVVVVAEDLGVDAGPPEREPDRLDQLRLLGHGEGHAGIAARIAVLGLVLNRYGVDRHPSAPVSLDELDEVARVGRVDAWLVDETPADQRAVRLHPRRGAPGRSDDLQPRVERQRTPQQRQDLRPVVRDREPAHVVVGAARGHVVIRVEAVRDEVRSTHRLAQEGQAVPLARAEQALHGRAAGPAVQAVEQVRRRVGDRGAEAVHGLVAPARVDADGQIWRPTPLERHGRLLGQPGGTVGSGHVHLNRRSRRRGGSGEPARNGGGDEHPNGTHVGEALPGSFLS